MKRERMEAWCAWAVQALLVTVIIYAPLAFGAAGLKHFAVVQWLMAGVALFWTGRLACSKAPAVFWPPVAWAVLLLLGYGAGRYLTADVEYIARQELLRLAVYALFFLALINHLPHPDSGRRWLAVLLAVGSVVALYAVAQFLTGSDRVWNQERPPVYAQRGSGSYISPNHMAGLLAMLLPGALILALGGTLPRWARGLAALSSVALLAGLVVSGSRGGWVAAGFSLILCFGWMVLGGLFRLKAALWLLCLAGLAACLVLGGDWSANRRAAFRDTSQLIDIRFNLWVNAVDMWRDHPWSGVGPAHFDLRYPQYRAADNTLQRRPQRVHNDYLNLLVDWGVIGAALVALIWGMWWWQFWRDWPKVRGSWFRRDPTGVALAPVTLAAMFGLSAIWAHALVDFNFHVPANALVAVSLMALVTAQGRQVAAQPRLVLGRVRRMAVCVGMVVLAGVVIIHAARLTAEQGWLGKAERASRYSLKKAQLLKKAHAVEPARAQTAYDIGECYRLTSWQGRSDYEAMALQALPWFERAMHLNRWDPLSRIRYGMCLDWLGRHEEAEPHYLEAARLDRNGYYTIAHVGWHYVQIGELITARKWFDRSHRLYWVDNPIATQYLSLIRRELEETNAAGTR